MATKFKCNDGIYTVLRNGKTVAIGATAGEAISAVTSDAGELACCDLEVTAVNFVQVGEQGGIVFTLNTTGNWVNLCYDNDSGANTGCIGCSSDTGSIGLGEISQYIIDPNGTELTFYVSNDNCATYCDSVVINNYVRIVEIPTGGGDTVAAEPAGTPACAGVTSYVELLTMGVTGATLNASTGDVTIPAQILSGGDSIYVYYKLCDGLVTGILGILITQTP